MIFYERPDVIPENVDQWISNFLLNLGSGLAGSAITILLYERLLARHFETERKEREVISISHLYLPINYYIIFLMGLNRAIAKIQPITITEKSRQLANVFGADFQQRLMTLDLRSQPYNFSNKSWIQLIEEASIRFRNAILQVTYLPFVDVKTIEILQGLVNSKWMNYIEVSSTYRGIPDNPFVVSMLRDYIELLDALIERYHQLARGDRSIEIFNLWEISDVPIGCSCENVDRSAEDLSKPNSVFYAPMEVTVQDLDSFISDK